MPYLLEIGTAVPEHAVTPHQLVEFYHRSLESAGRDDISRKLRWLSEKASIEQRYSCVSDFNGGERELFLNEDFHAPIEHRMKIYKDRILPLATDAIDDCLWINNLTSECVTHIMTVTCTGLMAPGLEFLISEKYGLQQAEKIALNFLGCYAALKAIKHANYIAQADPTACILIVCAELCSLHFHPTEIDEEIVSNLLFADGAAAVMIVGEDAPVDKHARRMQIMNTHSAYVPQTQDLMKWDISSGAFKMLLSKHIAKVIEISIANTVSTFLPDINSNAVNWAIHPGGVRIVDAVKHGLDLTDAAVQESLEVLKNFGNMPSPTILFVLRAIQNRLANVPDSVKQEIVACAFGPGINIEMIRFTSILAEPFPHEVLINHEHFST